MEPLERTTVTVASRIMLPAYTVLCILVGLGYLVDPGGKIGTAPVYDYQRQTMPLAWWGVIMLGLGGLMLTSLLVHNRWVFAYALCCCALTWFIWGCFFAASIVTTDFTSYLAPTLPWFVSTACIASVASLINKET